jgi:hypothetical protein
VSSDGKRSRWLRPVLVVVAMLALCLFLDFRNFHPLPWGVVYVIAACIVYYEVQRAVRHNR